ncbi:structural maintenance of chromosomes protein 3 [Lingula anatina]|uniref:Structural maintenance of chromosomes protein 3 n=1 Tax=Lingula anatina TaxID=7574 RepID=A0A1S3HAR6_LINAN|nr:structural maintenance of chromosomes protein 3 [Lingula anatina]|eukprot:XP_013382551.1 structural maintenance of chromosomes protein 3 [Lingula anatina]
MLKKSGHAHSHSPTDPNLRPHTACGHTQIDIPWLLRENKVFKERNREHRERIAQLETYLKDRQLREVIPLEEELAEKNEKISQLEKKIQSLKQQLKDKSAELSKEENENMELTERLRDADDLLEFINNDIINLTNHVRSRNGEKETKKLEKSASLKSTFADLRFTVQKQLDKNEAKIKELNKIHDVETKELGKRNVEVKQLERTLADTENEIETMLSLITKKGYINSEKRPDALQRGIEELRAHVENFVDYHNNIQKSILENSDLKGERDKLRERNSKLKIKLTAAEGEVLRLEEENRVFRRTLPVV